MEDIVVNEFMSSTVFNPTIKRIKGRMNNNLYDLLDIVPAKPILPTDNIVKQSCGFCPRYDKFYIPKRTSRLKVRTVRDIRKTLEDDTYTYLPSELERQQIILFKKIRRGFSNDEETKVLARKILQSDMPISRSTWQMLTNLNPEQYTYPEQFVIWNGKDVRVNGSKGGNNKYICHYDASCKKKSSKRTTGTKKGLIYKKQGLLRNSLAIKFKPGPLGRKKFLDDSHQKYHVGDTELVRLPEPGLDIHPTFGTSLEPLTYFLNNLRNEDGTISQKWAEFSVSVLGTVKNSDPVLINNDSVTFNLNYKCDQHRLLMRRDETSYIPKVVKTETAQSKLGKSEVLVLPEIKDMMEKILDCVEISLNRDNLYTMEEEPNELPCNEIVEDHTHNKDKIKRKYCELDRLDVTVIRIPQESEKDVTKTCDKAFCSLGCVCDSLLSSFHLRGHCGLVDCMFECKCDFTKYKAIDLTNAECSELIPELLNRGATSKLAKEEQKFHQTVILSGEKSIVLKSVKRSTKAPSKYADFYNHNNLKNDTQKKQTLSIIAFKINCDNIEPWCMVHKLYKCFCKGKFVETCTPDVNDIVTKEPSTTKGTFSRVHEKLSESNTDKDSSPAGDLMNDYTNLGRSTCSRVEPYEGRKYSAGYYKHTHSKIRSMEENDHKLRQKMMTIVNKLTNKENEPHCSKNMPENKKVDDDVNSHPATNLHQFLSSVDECMSTKLEANQNIITTRSKSKRLPNKTKLVAWLEHNYKIYKQSVDKGKTKTSLDPPKSGKVALYPWAFILSRYRERKNLFLISKQKPFRIFMGVHTQNPMFENCININDIRFADLYKYPLTVKNLLTNASDLKENFCILCGLSDCWELIGSVSKINDGRDTNKETSDTESRDPFDINPTWGDKSSLETKLNDKESFENSMDDDEKSSETTMDVDQPVEKVPDKSSNSLQIEKFSTSETTDDADTSKWFVMTVENDFSEIRFYKRGFFVKYESIVKAISVARVSRKTVRLSSQICMDNSSGPQFGIYAIPNTNEYCVFVGPYEKQDNLGIETINTILDIRKLKRTRGFWITTNKVDNVKVIDNPLSFMKTVQNSKIVSLDVHCEANSETNKLKEQENTSTEVKKNLPSTSTSPLKKVVKPIKIRKTNGFYHLDSNGILKKKPLLISKEDGKPNPELVTTCEDTQLGMLLKASNLPYNVFKKSTQSETFAPPKITAVYSRYNADQGNKPGPETGMLILKPEEINRKLLDNTLIHSPSKDIYADNNMTDQNIKSEVEMGQENSIDDVSDCIFVDNANDDICIISDDEESVNNDDEESGTLKDVWIECTNEKLGWIRGRRNSNNDISFQLFGCQYSDFYPEQEIFKKINDALSKAPVDLPREDLRWKIVESENEVTEDITEIQFTNLNDISFCEPLSRQSNVKTYTRTRPGTSVTLKTELMPEELLVPMANPTNLFTKMINAPDCIKQSISDTLKDMLSIGQDIDSNDQEKQ